MGDLQMDWIILAGRMFNFITTSRSYCSSDPFIFLLDQTVEQLNGAIQVFGWMLLIPCKAQGTLYPHPAWFPLVLVNFLVGVDDLSSV